MSRYIFLDRILKFNDKKIIFVIILFSSKMSTTIKDNNDNINNVTPDDPKIMSNNFFPWQPSMDNFATAFLNLPPPLPPSDKRGASQLVPFPFPPPPGFIRPPAGFFF
jgi:hypothetical protein